MIVLRLELLIGSYHASNHTLRSPEWPPHPDRVYQAFVATMHAEGNQAWHRETMLSIERAVWCITASGQHDRPKFIQYVPRNEDQGGGKGAYNPVFATARMKERYLPACEPDDPVVYYHIDSDADPDAVHDLSKRVSRIGRSHVAMAVVPDAPAPNMVPTQSGGEFLLRIPYAGRLADLESAFENGTRARFNWQSYQPFGTRETIRFPKGEFAEALVLAASGRGVDVTRVAPLLNEARKSVLSICSDPLPGWISGHAADGTPLKESHLGLAPTVFCGKHGDGRVMGLALLVPKHIAAEESRRCLQPVLDRGLNLAKQSWSVENGRSLTTQPAAWTRTSRTWVTATPMEIRRRDKRSSIEIAKEWTDRAGLPAPSDARIRAEPFINGPVHASRYAQGTRPRLRMHAKLSWDEPISGPVAIGMGRYRGFGLMLPTEQLDRSEGQHS